MKVRSQQVKRTSGARMKHEREHEPHGGRGVTPKGEAGGGSITLLGKSHQGGGGEGVVDPTMIIMVLRLQSPDE